MDSNLDFFADTLRRQNIRLSPYRLMVLEYLMATPEHPTADTIYVNLLRSAPKLSKTTIYNTLHTLTEAGVIRIVSIDDNEARYEIAKKEHGHFKCENCGAVIDFGLNIEALTTGDLPGFKINTKNVYFKGICPGCLSDIK